MLDNSLSNISNRCHTGKKQKQTWYLCQETPKCTMWHYWTCGNFLGWHKRSLGHLIKV